MGRMGPRTVENHPEVLDWLNNLIIDMKYWLHERKEQPVIPVRQLMNWQSYQRDLESCIGLGSTMFYYPGFGDIEKTTTPAIRSAHQGEINVITSLVADLTAIWNKQEPQRPITESRINEVEQTEQQLKECRHDPKHY